MRVGSFSWGVWCLEENSIWGAYRTHDAGGKLRYYRFDCLERLHVKETPDPDPTNSQLELWFHDLLLDARVDRVRTQREELLQVEIQDEDEVEIALENGLLSSSQVARINSFRELITTDTKRIIDIVDNAILASQPSKL